MYWELLKLRVWFIFRDFFLFLYFIVRDTSTLLAMSLYWRKRIETRNIRRILALVMAMFWCRLNSEGTCHFLLCFLIPNENCILWYLILFYKQFNFTFFYNTRDRYINIKYIINLLLLKICKQLKYLWFSINALIIVKYNILLLNTFKVKWNKFNFIVIWI